MSQGVTVVELRICIWDLLCSGAYRELNAAKDDPLVANSSYAEQSNAFLGRLKAGAVHMKQVTLMWMVRLFLYDQAKNVSRFHLKRNGAQQRRKHAAAHEQQSRLPVPAATEPEIAQAALFTHP